MTGRYARAPVALLNAPSTSRWFNFGRWPDGSRPDFPEAAAALARSVIGAARLPPAASVLDLACGEGESTRLLREEFGVGRALGIDLERARVRRAASGERALARAEALPLVDECLDGIVVVDAAYHFDPRERFFREARRCLRPGARVALCDFVLAREPSARIAWQRRIAPWLGVPGENLATERGYEASLRRAGFSAVEFEFIEDRVIPGFARFALSRRFRGRREMRGVRLAARAMRALHSLGVLRYAIVSAEAG